MNDQLKGISFNNHDKIKGELEESYDTFRTIAEESLIGILILQDYKVQFINQKAVNEIGYPREEIMNWTFEDLIENIHPEDKEFVRQQAWKKQKGEMDYVIDYEFRFIKKNGEINWVRNLSKSISYKGSPADLVFQIYITEQKKREEMIKGLARILSENPNLVIRAKKGIIIYINPSGTRLLGLKEHDRLPRFLEESANNSLKNNLVQNKEHVFGTKYFKFVITPIKEAGYINIYGEDITLRKIDDKKLRESEEKYRNIIDQNYDGYFETDLKGNFTNVNQRILNFTGLSRKDVIGHNFREFVAKEYVPIIKKAYNNLYQNELSQIVIEYPNIAQEGRMQFVQNATYLKYDQYGSIIGFYGVTKDIELRKRLEESEKKYKDLYEEAPNAYFSIDINGNIIKCNKYAQKLLGYTKYEFLTMKVMDLYAKNENGIEKAKLIFEDFLNGKEIFDQELQMKHKTGKYIWISLSIKPIIDNKGNVIESRSVVHDINDRKIAQQQLKNSEQNYKNALDRANFYKNLVAHDMNNILHGVISSTELCELYLNEYDNKDKLTEMLKITINCAERGSKLINNVRKLSKIEESNLSISKINLFSIIKDSMRFIRLKSQKSKVLLNIEPFSETLYVWANELLPDVIENIYTNALKYNENSTIEIFIKVSEFERSGSNYVKLEFVDNGIGIEDNRKKKIFEYDNSDSKGGKGMGIGLSLVKKIVESYGGSIHVEDRILGDYSKGSNFILIIPKV
ncbi:MAG: PAS domain S-box protein [Promethearchaeota archaeon]